MEGLSRKSSSQNSRGLRRIGPALRYSFAGLGAAFRHEAAFRQEVMLALILVPTALLLPVNALGKALMIGSALLVLIVELINSAIEASVDRVSLESHPLAKRAKDLGSAAVFMSLVNAAAIWLLVLLG
ncbi:MAG: diacylglycerol kinase [Sulfuricella sp.]|nr:diacylglycerol kinase [Sulfuricella sp.]